jgi:Na+:H+ antiporter, NhaA family
VRGRVRDAVVDPVTDFLQDETAGGLVLLVATLAAVVWANSPAGDGYEALWETKVVWLDLEHWINDGLMAVFFFIVGLEIKRELVAGELNDPRTAALPALAAVAGVALPVAIFALLVAGGEGASGWAIPAATDIAFAVGVLALLGDRVSSGVRLLLLTIAIVDDIIAITIIAVFYAGDVSLAWLAGAAALVAVVVVLQRAGVARIAVFAVVGVALWFAVHESGVHATVAGVVLGLLTPARPVGGRDVLRVLEHRLHPVSAFVIVPLFALANAGVDFGGGVLADALESRLTWAVVAGLVVGKLCGVTGATLLALRARAGALPEGVSRAQVPGVGALAGIGFTVSLFIASLAFEDEALVDAAKVGIFVGSIVSGVLGAALLVAVRRRASA